LLLARHAGRRLAGAAIYITLLVLHVTSRAAQIVLNHEGLFLSCVNIAMTFLAANVQWENIWIALAATGCFAFHVQ